MKKFIIGLIIVIIIVVVIAILSGEPEPTQPPGPPPPGVTPPPAVTPPPKVTPPPATSIWDKIRAEQMAKTSSEWGKPTLAPVSTDNHEDGAYISGDGNSLYFAYYPGDLFNDLAKNQVRGSLKTYKSDKPFTTKKLYQVARKGGIFSEGGVMISGKDVYYMTNEPTSDSDTEYDDNIYRNGELLPFNKPNRSEGDPHYCAAKGELYYWIKPSSSADTGSVGADIYVYKNGKESKLPAPINTDDTGETMPFLTPDCNTMYFATNRSDIKGVIGPAIYISKRTGDSWSKPVPVVWTEKGTGVGEPTLTDDGQTLFFIQVLETSDGKFNGDIFYVKRK